MQSFRRVSHFIAVLQQAAILNYNRTLHDFGLYLDRKGSVMTNDIAYLQRMSRHRPIMPVSNKKAVINKAWIAPNATLVGEVLVGTNVRIWYNVVIRGEVNPVRIGNFSEIGDQSVLSASASLPVGIPGSINIGKNVRIGNSCSIFSSIIDDNVVIGDKVVIMEGCRIERGAVIAPHSVVPAGSQIPGNQLWAGSPVAYVRDLKEEELWQNYEASYGSIGGETYALHPSLASEKKEVKAIEENKESEKN